MEAQTTDAAATAAPPMTAGAAAKNTKKKKKAAATKPNGKAATAKANGKPPAAKKAAAPTGKPAKKAAASTANHNGGGVFRDGTTKAGIFAIIKDGKVHSRSDIKEFIAKEGKSVQLLAAVLEALPEKGYKIVQNDKDGLQIAKKAGK